MRTDAQTVQRDTGWQRWLRQGDLAPSSRDTLPALSDVQAVERPASTIRAALTHG